MNELGYAAYTVKVLESPGFESRVGTTMYVPYQSNFDFEGRVCRV